MGLTQETIHAITAYLKKELNRYITETKISGDVRDLMPFHARPLPPLFKVKLSERSFSTRSGGWFQEIALLVAKQFHPVAELQHDVEGRIQTSPLAQIDMILEQMDKGRPKRKPNRTKDIDDVRNNQASGGVDRTIRADLYVKTAVGHEWYFEMKTAQPNKGQCKELKRFILLVAALRYETRGEAFAAMAYNPLGDGQPIRDGKIKQFLENGTDVLMGRPFWRKIGDDSTYDELLAISEAVGKSFEALLISEGIVKAC